MNKYILFLFFFAISIYAQEPSIKFYLEDGSFKSYLVSALDSLSVSKSDSKYVMHIYYQDTNIAYFPNEIIQSVKIEKDTSRQLYLNVYIFGYPKPYLVDDIDSIVFKIDKWQPLTIGTQVWMLKNLDVDHYRNSDSIPEVRVNKEWKNLNTGAWCYFNNSDSLGKIYGKLYNWFAVDDNRGLAPIGWHVASEQEWKILTTFLGGDSIAGGKMREKGTTHWISPNSGASNESGFSALPGCYRVFDGGFHRNYCGVWWTSSGYSQLDAMFRTICYYSNFSIEKYHYNKVAALSVRCVKD